MLEQETVPLEDELGDVLEKAARHAALNYEQIARAAQVDIGRLRDALDYRSELMQAELGRLARVLQLNEVGLCALAQGCYPQPPVCGLPFALHPLRMPFGVGVANAYLLSTGGERGVLFDTGASHAELHRAWPPAIQELDAVFITHYEAEHIGGLDVVLRETGLPHFFGPPSGRWPQCRGLGEGESVEVGGLRITALHTPGHAAAHNCYTVALAGSSQLTGTGGAPLPACLPDRGEGAAAPDAARDNESPDDVRQKTEMSSTAPALLVSGDLIFAGSLGGGYFCCQRQMKHGRRVLEMLSDDVLIAPGHGPLTTVGHERRFNPFLG